MDCIVLSGHASWAVENRARTIGLEGAVYLTGRSHQIVEHHIQASAPRNDSTNRMSSPGPRCQGELAPSERARRVLVGL
jgi:hypothetical protein